MRSIDNSNDWLYSPIMMMVVVVVVVEVLMGKCGVGGV